MRDLDASLAREVAVELKLFLQLERLVARVRLTTAAPLRRVRTCTHDITFSCTRSVVQINGEIWNQKYRIKPSLEVAPTTIV